MLPWLIYPNKVHYTFGAAPRATGLLHSAVLSPVGTPGYSPRYTVRTTAIVLTRGYFAVLPVSSSTANAAQTDAVFLTRGSDFVVLSTSSFTTTSSTTGRVFFATPETAFSATEHILVFLLLFSYCESESNYLTISSGTTIFLLIFQSYSTMLSTHSSTTSDS